MTQLALFDGVQERDRILAAMSENHRVYLTTLRSFAREYALRHGSVTIDDVRGLCAQRRFPMPSEIGADERVFGTVFRSSEFVAVGSRLSSREERIARSGRGSSHVTVYEVR